MAMNGLFEFQLMLFGLCNSPATFQKVMQKALAGLNQFCSMYTDDVIVYSKSVDEDKVNLEKVSDRLRQKGLKLHPEKCKLGCSEVLYLGHVVGILPNPEKVKAVQDFPVLTKEKSLREFLGLASYYRCFVPKLAKWQHHCML